MNPSFLRRFLPLWALGLIGVLSLAGQELPPALLREAPQLRELPQPVLRALLLANPLMLVTLGAVLGAAAAPRVGLRSLVAGQRGAAAAPLLAAGCGLALALLLGMVDVLAAPWLGPGWQALQQQAHRAPVLPALLVGMLYGGIAEEIITRWGLMAAVAWAVARLARTAEPQPPAVVWVSILAAAAAFAAGHLPALAQQAQLSGPLVARTLALNAGAGIVYGWLCWRRSLEAAMISHACTHAGFAAWRLVW